MGKNNKLTFPKFKKESFT